MSYSTVARNSRRRNNPPTKSGEGGHKREHSANTAGDVFAMFGAGAAGNSNHAPSSTTASVGHDRLDRERKRQKSNGADSASSSSVDTPSAASDEPSLSRSDVRSSAGSANSKRFQSLYPKPVLLALWSADRTAKLQHDDLLYSSFESYDQQRLNNDMADTSNLPGGQQRYHHFDREKGGDRSSSERERTGSRRNPPGEYTGALGRLPTGNSTVSGQPHFRRNVSGGTTGPASPVDRYGSVGIQGGVMGGISNTADRRRNLASGEGGQEDAALEGSQHRLRGATRMPSYGHRGDSDRPEKPSTPAWSNSRWRHLQDEAGSSSSSSKEDEDPWSADADWKPAAKDPIKEGRNSLPSNSAKTLTDGLVDWDEDDGGKKEPLPSSQVVAQPPDPAILSSSISQSTGDSTVPPKSTQSKAALFFDDLLAPVRSPSSHGQNATTAVNPAPTSAPLSFLNLNADPLGSSTRRPEPLARQTSGYHTPTRSSTAEALEILARRSPVTAVHPDHGLFSQQQQPMPQPTKTERPENIFWQYRDPSGQLQGPFSAIQMQDWFQQQFFPETLLVKRVESPDFETLGALMMRVGDAKTPFLSSPVVMRLPPGIGYGGISQSPIGQRTGSPAIWQQHASATSSRQGSISGASAQAPGNAVYDLFASHGHILSPQPTQPSQYSYAQSAPQQALASQHQSESAQVPHGASLDPWGDTMPASPAIRHSVQRSTTESPAPALVESSFQRAIGIQQAQAAPGSPLVQQAQPPIARNVKEHQEADAISGTTGGSVGAQPSVQTAPAVPDAPAKLEGKKNKSIIEETAKPTPEAVDPPTAQAVKDPKSASTLKNAVEKSAIAVSAQKIASTEPSAPVKKQEPIANKGGKVTTSTQEAFEKAKQAASSASSTSAEYPLAPSPLSASPVAVKGAPWAKTASEEAVPATPTEKKPTSSLSLREIQAREAEETAIRRAAEKKAHAAALAAQEATLAAQLQREAAEALPSSSTWGAMSTTASPATTTISSPWAKPTVTKSPAAVATPAKKGSMSLKEIQEEEARRKKAAADKAAAANQPASGKGYAGSIGVVRPSPPVAVGGPWTTVGAKPASPAPTVAAASPAVRAPAVNGSIGSKPAVPSLATRLSSSQVGSAKPAAVSSPVVTSSVKPVSISRSVPNGAASIGGIKDDATIPASTDLLKWCRDALKGLDIPVDEFISMLLSFPVPIDKSTRELISDSVYSSSRTLDGRHFADAFADKRSADVKAIKSGKATLPPKEQPREVKIPSMADAVKFVPAPQKQPDNFKIVTKTKGKAKK